MLEVFNKFKNCYTHGAQLAREGIRNVGQGNIRSGVRSIMHGGAKVIAAGFSATEGLTVRNKDIPVRKKILPLTLYATGTALTAVFGLAVVFGLSTIVPPLAFASSCGSVMRHSSDYFKERAAYKNLNHQLVEEDMVQRAIQNCPKLTAFDHKDIADYFQKPKEIYKALYQLRASLISDNDLSSNQKKEYVKNINSLIEGMYHTNQLPVNMDDFGAKYAADVQHIKNQFKRFEDSTNAAQKLVDEKKLPKSVYKKIKQHKQTRENIYAQDLPLTTKQRLEALLENRNFKKQDVKLIYAQMANHQLNKSNLKQLHHHDENILLYVRSQKPEFSENQIQLVNEFIQTPRDVVDLLTDIKARLDEKQKELFDNTVLSPFLTAAHTSGKTFEYEKCLSGLQAFSKINNVAQAEDKIHSLQKLEHKIQELFVNEPSSELLQQINKHQKNSLLFYQQQAKDNFASPNIKLNEPNYDMAKVAAKKTGLSKEFGKIKARFKKAKDEAHQQAVEDHRRAHFSRTSIYQVESLEAVQANHKQARKEMAKEFETMTYNAEQLLHKSAKRNFYKKALPRRLGEVAASAGSAILCGVSSLLLPLAFAPGGQASLIATIGLGAISTGLSVGATVDSLDLIRREKKSEAKIKKPKHTAKKGLMPNIEDEYKRHNRYKKAFTQQKEINPGNTQDLSDDKTPLLTELKDRQAKRKTKLR